MRVSQSLSFPMKTQLDLTGRGRYLPISFRHAVDSEKDKVRAQARLGGLTKPLKPVWIPPFIREEP